MKNFIYRAIPTVALLTLCGRAPCSATSPGFTTIDVPNADFTEAHGINDEGQIVGFYCKNPGCHGFLDAGGHFTTSDVPGADGTETLGINDPGQTVGYGCFLNINN